MDTPISIYSRLLYDIWLQDGGTKCSDDTGKQKEKKCAVESRRQQGEQGKSKLK